MTHTAPDCERMRRALRLARRGFGATSPNPMVGALLVKAGQIIGRGWHHRAGRPHAEIEALYDAAARGHNPRGATLYVTLEPCSTQGRTPPCTEALIRAGLRRVVIGAADPNPLHAGRAFALLRYAGFQVLEGVLADECAQLNEPFNHWIVHRTPFVTVKAAMTLDGKIATAVGQSKWITSEPARAFAMSLRQGADALLVGINTVLLDDPSLTFRPTDRGRPAAPLRRRSVSTAGASKAGRSPPPIKQLRRIVLDSQARTPLNARVVSDDSASLTTVFVSQSAPKNRVAALAKRVRVEIAPPPRPSSAPAKSRADTAPARLGWLDLRWVLQLLGAENVTSLLVEGGGEMNASFLLGGLAQRIAFFYAPKILGGRKARHAVAGEGAGNLAETLDLMDLKWRALGPDWLLSARVKAP
jgi:diaminohydroxyphosphoribosylaminopyrimidine deaminase / 5-amino-6-(5-phosphoribosylamino)uracil reductase